MHSFSEVCPQVSSAAQLWTPIRVTAKPAAAASGGGREVSLGLSPTYESSFADGDVN